MMKATYLGVYFCAFVYMISGIIAYLTYQDTMTGGSVLNSLINDLKLYDDPFLKTLLFIVCFSFLVSSTMSIPLMFIGLKKNFINTMIFCKKKYCMKKKINR